MRSQGKCTITSYDSSRISGTMTPCSVVAVCRLLRARCTARGIEGDRCCGGQVGNDNIRVSLGQTTVRNFKAASFRGPTVNCREIATGVGEVAFGEHSAVPQNEEYCIRASEQQRQVAVTSCRGRQGGDAGPTPSRGHQLRHQRDQQDPEDGHSYCPCR